MTGICTNDVERRNDDSVHASNPAKGMAAPYSYSRTDNRYLYRQYYIAALRLADHIPEPVLFPDHHRMRVLREEGLCLLGSPCVQLFYPDGHFLKGPGRS